MPLVSYEDIKSTIPQPNTLPISTQNQPGHVTGILSLFPDDQCDYPFPVDRFLESALRNTSSLPTWPCSLSFPHYQTWKGALCHWPMVYARYTVCDSLELPDWASSVASKLGEKEKFTKEELTTLYGPSVYVGVRVEINAHPKEGDDDWVGSEGKDVVYVSSPDLPTVKTVLEKYNSCRQSEFGLGSHQLLILLDRENISQREEPITFAGTTSSMGMVSVDNKWEVKELGMTFQSIDLVVQSISDNPFNMPTLPQRFDGDDLGPTEEEKTQAWGFLSQTATL